MSRRTTAVHGVQGARPTVRGKSAAQPLGRKRARPATSACQLRSEPHIRSSSFRLGSRHVSLHSPFVTSALQQRESTDPATQEEHGANNSAFGISLDQLQQLAGSKGGSLYENSEFNSIFQLAESLRVSLDFGLVNDASDLDARRVTFGGNRLPDKPEVTSQTGKHSMNSDVSVYNAGDT